MEINAKMTINLMEMDAVPHVKLSWDGHVLLIHELFLIDASTFVEMD